MRALVAGSQIKGGKRVGVAGTKYSIIIKSYNAMTKEMCLGATINPTCDPKLSPSRNACCEAELNKVRGSTCCCLQLFALL